MNALKHLQPARVVFFAALFFLLLLCCEKNGSLQATGKFMPGAAPPTFLSWTVLANLPFPDAISGDIPNGQVSPQGFEIKGRGYLCGGITITFTGQAEELKHLWEFNPAGNAWTQKASFPGPTPDAGANFVIGGAAYIVVNSQNWRYEQSTNTWTQKANMPGHSRGRPTGFAIKERGYVGFGSDLTISGDDLKDFYEYNPGSDSWRRRALLPGSKREGAMGFVIGGDGYVCSGMHAVSGNPTIYLKDLWEFNAAANKWKKRANLPANGRAHGIGLSGLGHGFAGTGSDGSGFYQDFWEYTAATNSWKTLPNIGARRDQAGSFFIGKNIYVAGGTAGLDGMKDFWTLPL